MALPGRKPKRADQIRHTEKPRYEYRSFPNVPNPHPRPLPHASALKAATGIARWPVLTRDWWNAVSRMPHTVAWEDGDWSYAVETALIHAQFVTGDVHRLAPELRRRNHELGATWEGRRDLRIMYLTDDGQEIRENKDPAVTAMDDYRKAVE